MVNISANWLVMQHALLSRWCEFSSHLPHGLLRCELPIFLWRLGDNALKSLSGGILPHRPTIIWL